MKKRIIIIGKSSFIGKNIFFHLKKKYQIQKYDLKYFLSINNSYLDNVDWIINCSIKNNYIKDPYKEKNDFDLRIAKKIFDLGCKYIFLSSRKIYKISNNITERSKVYPKCNYSKNKLITEKKLSRILKNNLLILRISNLIGKKDANFKKKRGHKTFIDHFFYNIKKGFVFKNRKIYKDFLSIHQFSIIIGRLIDKNITGIYNVSIGKKIYLKNLIEWLNYYNKENYMYIDLPKNYNDDCFFLNNKKLCKKININLKLSDLKKDCKKISQIFFEK